MTRTPVTLSAALRPHHPDAGLRLARPTVIALMALSLLAVLVSMALAPAYARAQSARYALNVTWTSQPVPAGSALRPLADRFPVLDLSNKLRAVVQETMQSASVGLWLRPVPDQKQ